MKLHIWMRGVSCRRSVTLASIFLELFPFVTFSYLDNNSYSTYSIELKLHICIDFDEMKCCTQDP